MKDFKKNIYRLETEIYNPCPDCIAHDVTIGTQVWTGCNANTEYYSNGNIIPQVTDQTTWNSLTTGAWCWYNNDPANESTYGKLYNWYAITDPRGIAPAGYHVPTDAEWNTLITSLGGLGLAGGKMKEAGFCHWASPNAGASNISGFTGLPGGSRGGGGFGSKSFIGEWWTPTASDTNNAYSRRLVYNLNSIDSPVHSKNDGLSVRFIKD